MSTRRQDKRYIYNDDNKPDKFSNVRMYLRNRWLLVLLLLASFISVILIIQTVIAPLPQWRPAEFFAMFTIILSIVTILERSYKNFVQKQYRIIPTLTVSISDNTHVKINASIHNSGSIRLEPDNISLFVDSGVLNLDTKKYDFPFLLKHEQKEGRQKYDCILSEYCQSGKSFYPKDIVDNDPPNNNFKECFRMCYKLLHLSAESILYIDSGETFSEDIIIKLDTSGVYRAILIVTAKNKDCDCTCTSQQFVIQVPKEANEEPGGKEEK